MTRPLFSLLHASARLPEGWVDAMYAWLRMADHPENAEYLLAIDQGRYRELPITARMPPHPPWFQEHGPLVVINSGRPCAVDAWNAAAAASSGRFLITIADDYRPPAHWDSEIIAALRVPFKDMNVRGEYVLDVDNQDNSAPLLPFAFLTRPYYRRLCELHGGLFYPEYEGLMCDADFTDIARADGVVIDAKHLKFEHLHPDQGKGKDDAVYQRMQATYPKGKEIYARREAERKCSSVSSS